MAEPQKTVTTDAEITPEVFNPDLKKEVIGGLGNSLIFFLGMIASIVGIVFAISYLLIGDLIWLVGSGLIVWTIARNAKQKHGKGFKIANIVAKAFLLFLSLVIIVLVNITPR
jgi:type IV secretory pathway TrbD component